LTSVRVISTVFAVRRPIPYAPSSGGVAAAAASPLLTGSLDATGLAAVSIASMLGASTAKRAGMSTMGALTMAGVCGVGGGTVRDVLLGQKAFWLDQPKFLWFCLASGLVGVYGWEKIKARLKIDEGNAAFRNVFAASLGGAALGGARTAFGHAGGDVASAAFFAMLSAAGGGVVADLLLGRRPRSLYPEGLPWVLPSAVGSAAYVAATKLGMRSLNARIALAVASAVALNTAMLHNVAEPLQRWGADVAAILKKNCPTWMCCHCEKKEKP
jgi:uncharacterized membrane protein YeiH